MREKVDPYLDLYMTHYMTCLIMKNSKKIEVGDIEIAPLAFMREEH